MVAPMRAKERGVMSVAISRKPTDAGDVIFTGTPAGVGAVSPGNELRGGIDGLSDIALTIAA